MEIATLTREDGKTKIKVLKQKEVEELIKRHEAEEAKAEKDKKEKEQKEKDKWAVDIFPLVPPNSCCFVFFIKSVETDGCVIVFLKTQLQCKNIIEHNKVQLPKLTFLLLIRCENTYNQAEMC